MEAPSLHIIESKAFDLEKFDSVLIVLEKAPPLSKLSQIPKPLAEEFESYAKRIGFKGKPGQSVHLDFRARRICIAVLPKRKQMFGLLEWGRGITKVVRAMKPQRIGMDLREVGEVSPAIADALVSAIWVAAHRGPKYSAKAAKKTPFASVTIATTALKLESVKKRAERAEGLALGTNLVRTLANMAGNDLTSTRYVRLATETARARGLKTEFLGIKKLKEMKAGAFLAVAQGSEDQGGGILKVMYEPPRGAKGHIALVGKGITFDTGGSNLKTGSHMFGMHEDMTGSAIVLALALLAQREKWPIRVSAYLAITDNALSQYSYRPNDVITSLKGKTIEVVDTDAEGRLVLADTLHLASQERPQLVLDFATLTGACIRAIGTAYAGAYTNRPQWFGRIVRAGKAAGERIWPFPSDADYGRCLKSDVADLKQCRVSGGSDHIEAGYFLSQFVDKKVPWIHVDLSAAANDGGLAHVPTKSTGYGVRVGLSLIAEFLGLSELESNSEA